MEKRSIIVTCNDFQGDDPEAVQAAFAGAKMIKGVFDGVLKATKKGRKNLTPDENQKLNNMSVTVKVMKVDF